MRVSTKMTRRRGSAFTPGLTGKCTVGIGKRASRTGCLSLFTLMSNNKKKLSTAFGKMDLEHDFSKY